MGRWFIFLIALGVLSENGFNISTWVWVVTIAITCVGTVGTILTLIEEAR